MSDQPTGNIVSNSQMVSKHQKLVRKLKRAGIVAAAGVGAVPIVFVVSFAIRNSYSKLPSSDVAGIPLLTKKLSDTPAESVDNGGVSTGNATSSGGNTSSNNTSGGGGTGGSSGGSTGGSTGGTGGTGGSSGGGSTGGTGGSSGGGSTGGGTGGTGGSSGGGSCGDTTGAGGYPLPNLCGRANSSNTGPRYSCTTTLNGIITTSSDGQVFDRVCINGILRINHHNVVVRDTLIMGTGLYALDIGRNAVTCPANTRVEYTEVNMVNAANMDWGVYQRCSGNHVFDHVKVHNTGRPMSIDGGITITNSYFYSNRTQDGAHRTALSAHGGSNFTVTGNTFICVNTGCSSSSNMYSDYAPITNYLFQNNLLAGGSICLRGGETHSYATETSNIRILNNRFSTVYNPQCGTFQAIAQFDFGGPQNVASGNVFHESGAPIPSYY